MRSRVGGQSAVFQKDRTDIQSKPAGQLASQSVVGRAPRVWRWTGARLFGREKAGGGRREAECTRTRSLYYACGESAAWGQAQRRATEGQAGETLAGQACLGLGARCRIQACQDVVDWRDWIAGDLDDPGDQERS
jgi:hypothetical protein